LVLSIDKLENRVKITPTLDIWGIVRDSPPTLKNDTLPSKAAIFIFIFSLSSTNLDRYKRKDRFEGSKREERRETRGCLGYVNSKSCTVPVERSGKIL
jgi:hypothetical protein